MFKSIVISFVLAFASCSAFADTSPPVINAIANTHMFTSVDQAAENALADANRHIGVEYGGVIYEIAGKFYYSDPVTTNDNQAVTFRIRLQHDAHIVALFHTHPKGQNNDQFSECDIKMARTLKVPSYIVIQDTQQIKVFRTGVDPVYEERVGGEPDILWAAGKKIGQVARNI